MIKLPAIHLLLTPVLLLALCLESRAEEVVTWPYFDFPPLFMSGEDGPEGIAPDVIELLDERMEGYGHVMTFMPASRMFASARRGEELCIFGIVRTPEREDFLVYSRPLRLVPPLVMVFRAGERPDFGKEGKTLSLAEVLDSGDYLLGDMEGLSNGEELDEIIAEHGNAENVKVFYKDTYTESRLDMLLSGRIDVYIGSIPELRLAMEERGNLDDVEYARIKEGRWMLGHAACPNTSWGTRVVEAINSALSDREALRRLESIYISHMEGMVPEGYHSHFGSMIASPMLAGERDR
jgi:uncharacterized protein (TIGR02285 family)